MLRDLSGRLLGEPAFDEYSHQHGDKIEPYDDYLKKRMADDHYREYMDFERHTMSEEDTLP